jgi:acyl-CoA thioesterase-1
MDVIYINIEIMYQANLYHVLFAILLVISCSNVANQESGETQESKVLTFEKTILFFGNSLTAGFGVDEEEAFPGLIQKKIIESELDYKVINGGLSGETTASGLSRLDWFLEEEPTIFVLELGGNDGLRGIPLDETERNLQAIISKVRSRYPKTIIILSGMEIPPNMGPEYTDTFRKIYPNLVSENKGIIFIPFLLEGVGGNPDLNLPDGIHPTAQGHEIVANTVWKYLFPLL